MAETNRMLAITINEIWKMFATSNIEEKSFFKATTKEPSRFSFESIFLKLCTKNRTIIRYKMNLNDKLPKSNLKIIGINVRTSISNKKNDKTLIIDNLSK